MPKYIDADLIEWKTIAVPMLDGMLVRTKTIDGVYADKKDIDAIPAAAVQEVKYGKWMGQAKIRKDGEVRLVHWQCSLCGCFLGTNTAKYCPNCGAQMSGGEEDEN